MKLLLRASGGPRREVLEKERIREVADVERVARELRILKLMRHPHIVQLSRARGWRRWRWGEWCFGVRGDAKLRSV